MKKKYFSIITLASIVIGVTGCFGQSGVKPFSRKVTVQEPEMAGWTFTPEEVLHMRKEYTVNQLYGVNSNTKYVYLHLNEFMQTATVFRKGPVSRLAISPLPQLSAVKAKSDLGEITLDEYLLKSEIQGIIVLHHGKIVYERYPRMSETDKHIYFSLSKPLVATAIALLEDDGAISAQDPVGKYLPELNKSDWGKVRILDILNMSSGMTGLQFDDPEAQTDSNNIYFRFASCMGLAKKTESVGSSIWDIFNKMKKQKEPGLAFEYSSTNTVILSLLVERVAGKRFSDFISDRIWKKIGAEADGYIGLSATGIASTSATMNSTLRDLARFGLLFTPSWQVVCREKLISDSYLQKILAGDGNRSAYDKGVMGKQIIHELGEIPDHNSYQWDAIMADGDFFKSGTNGQGLYISRSRDLVIACFAHSNHSGKAYLRAIATSRLFAK